MTDDPYRAYSFILKIDGKDIAGFTEASGLGADVETIAYREGGTTVRRLPGQVRYHPMTLSYGIGQYRVLWDWFSQTADGEIQPRNVSVVLFSNDGQTEASRWTLKNAWPSAFRAAPTGSTMDEIAIESLTLVYDGLERA